MKTLTIILGITFLAITSFAQMSTGKKGAPATTPAVTAKTAPAPKPSGKAVVGTVINVANHIRNGKGGVSVADAKTVVKEGGTLAILAGSKVYFVSNPDGSSAGNTLAGLAGGKVSATGRTFSRAGLNLIVADNVTAAK